MADSLLEVSVSEPEFECDDEEETTEEDKGKAPAAETAEAAAAEPSKFRLKAAAHRNTPPSISVQTPTAAPGVPSAPKPKAPPRKAPPLPPPHTGTWASAHVERPGAVQHSKTMMALHEAAEKTPVATPTAPAPTPKTPAAPAAAEADEKQKSSRSKKRLSAEELRVQEMKEREVEEELGKYGAFRHHFWGHDKRACYNAAAGVGNASSASDKEGMDVLERATGVSVDVMTELLAFLQERADAEEQYSKRMGKLAGVAEGAPNAAGTALATAKNDLSGGMRALLAQATEEARQQALAHRALARAYEQAAAALRDDLRNYKAARKNLLGEAGVATKDKMQLEATVRKQKTKYVEAVSRKDGSAKALATLEAQGRPPQDIAKQRVKAQKNAKDEMVADQELKEAIDRLSFHHPLWVARMGAMMDGLQAHEEQRLAVIAKGLEATAQAQLDGLPALQQAAQSIAAAAQQLDAAHELAEWVHRAQTGETPSLPPVYVPRTNRQFLADAVVDALSEMQKQKSSASLHGSGRSQPHSAAASSASAAAAADDAGVGTARAIKNFIGEEADEIDFLVDEQVTVLSTCDDSKNGWWIGRCRNRVGWFPASFVQLLDTAKDT